MNWTHQFVGRNKRRRDRSLSIRHTRRNDWRAAPAPSPCAFDGVATEDPPAGVSLRHRNRDDRISGSVLCVVPFFRRRRPGHSRLWRLAQQRPPEFGAEAHVHRRIVDVVKREAGCSSCVFFLFINPKEIRFGIYSEWSRMGENYGS